MQTENGKAPISRRPAYFLLALTPILAVLLPWDFGPVQTTYRIVVADYSLTAPIIQLLVYSSIMRRNKLTLFKLNWFSSGDKIAALILGLCVAYTSFFIQIFSFAAVVGLLIFYIHIIFSLAIYQDIPTRENRDLENFWIALGLATFVYALLWVCGYIAYPPAPDDWTRNVPGVTNVRWTGFFWLATFAAGLAIAGRSEKPIRILAIIFGIFGLTLAIWTGSRGALLAIIGSAAGLLVFAPRFRKISLRYIAITFTLSVSLSAVLPVPIPQYGLARILGYAQSMDEFKRGDSGRIEIWKSTMKLVKNQPLAGHGIDQFQRMGPEKTLGFKGPHSWPMQVLFSIGFLGAGVLIYGAIRFLLLFQMQVEHPHQLAALAYFSGGSVYMLYDNFLYYTFPITIYTVSALMIFRLRSNVAVKTAAIPATG
ncbi:O-antigen ligase family protein [Parasphingorhabdus sp.]|uniref:O-antigen ligase family protein n=1 Tax=Parasphingorhabdus sp. TaxID=2709688 RepID=UPI0032653EF1